MSNIVLTEEELAALRRCRPNPVLRNEGWGPVAAMVARRLDGPGRPSLRDIAEAVRDAWVRVRGRAHACVCRICGLAMSRENRPL